MGPESYYSLKLWLLSCRDAFIHVGLKQARMCVLFKKKKKSKRRRVEGGEEGEEEIILEDPASKFDSSSRNIHENLFLKTAGIQ